MHDLLFGACLEGENLELSLGLFQFWFRASALPCGHCWDVWGLCHPSLLCWEGFPWNHNGNYC